MTDEATRTHTCMGVNRGVRGSAILSCGAQLRSYLCNGAYEEHEAWTRKTLALALRLVGIYHDGRTGNWNLLSGWKRRLASAGLSEECTIVDAKKWERAYKQLLERGNYDPAIAEVESAMVDPVNKGGHDSGEAIGQDKSKEEVADGVDKGLGHTGFTVKVGKRITFGNT